MPDTITINYELIIYQIYQILMNKNEASVFSPGRIEMNETEFVAAQRVTLEATGFTPDDYNAFQQFGVVTEVSLRRSNSSSSFNSV